MKHEEGIIDVIFKNPFIKLLQALSYIYLHTKFLHHCLKYHYIYEKSMRILMYPIKTLQVLTFLWSGSSPSHIEATILETSPNVALGFCPLMAACVSRKNRAYADTGLGKHVWEFVCHLVITKLIIIHHLQKLLYFFYEKRNYSYIRNIIAKSLLSVVFLYCLSMT